MYLNNFNNVIASRGACGRQRLKKENKTPWEITASRLSDNLRYLLCSSGFTGFAEQYLQPCVMWYDLNISFFFYSNFASFLLASTFSMLKCQYVHPAVGNGMTVQNAMQKYKRTI